MRLALLTILLLVSCSGAPPAVPSPTAVTSATAAAATGSAVPAASPTPLPSMVPGVRATPAGAIPDAFRYVALDTPLADGFRTRLWLVDLGARRAPLVVAEWDAPASPVGGHSVSADGKTVVISATATRSRVALYVLRPETGNVRVLFEDPSTIVISPRVSADGSRFAFTEYPSAGGSDAGIWSGPTGGGQLTRIADASTASNVPAMPLAWSTDGSWLAFTRDVSLERTEVHLAPRDGGPEIAVGEGDRVTWRAAAPQLLVSVPSTPASRAYTFDLGSGKSTDVVKAEKLFVSSLQWHPSLDRFLYVESESAGREASGGIWLRNADGSAAEKVSAPRAAYAPEWSRDGSLLTALGGGDDALVPVILLPSGRQVSVLCRRGATPPGSCL